MMYLYKFALLAGCVLPLFSATLPTGFTEQSITGLSVPTAMAFAPDGRLFICQQSGQLRIVKNGALLPTPFVTVTTDTSIERGLGGVVVPDSQYVYVYYTVPGTPARNRLSRFTQAGDVAAAGSELVIMEFEALAGAIHNGGALRFGPDGKLYVSVGENGVASNAQTLANRMGKILRLDLNVTGYIPTDNPFYGTATGDNRAIWAYGLRNPFTFSFQPGTGRMFINDVGKDAFEEVNEGVKGANYGWPTTEGPFNIQTYPTFKNPFYAYDHSQGCAITGGTFYNPSSGNFPSSYVGKYFFLDYCQGWIRVLDPSTGQATGFATGLSSPVALEVSPTGSLYYLNRGSNSVVKVDYTAGQAPKITQHPQSISVPDGEMASFTVAASGEQPVNYQWQKGTTDINGATGSTLNYGPVTTADNGVTFRAKATNTFGNDTSNSATLTVTPNNNNQAPTGTITAPVVGSLYSAGQSIAFAATGTDPEDGTLPAANFCWVVDFHHDTHLHPFLPQTCGVTSGTVNIPTIGETSSNVWYRFNLTVRDSGGRTHTSFRDVMPRKVTLTLQSNPAGLLLTLDGQPMTSLVQVTSVVGILRSIGAPGQPPLNGSRLGFASWSDSGGATHDIATPAVDTTYTAQFAPQFLLAVAGASGVGGTVTAVPPLGDGFYNTGTSVTLTAIPSPGYKFVGWGGDAAGTENPVTLTMSSPRTASASFTELSAPCTYSLGNTLTTVAFSGDIRKINVITSAGCAWQAQSGASWITILSGGTGSSNGFVRLRVDPSTEGSPRTGTVTIAGITYTITQGAANCLFDLSGPAFVLSGIASTYQLNITTGPSCQWNATTYPSQVTITGAASGTGSGTLRFFVPQNDSGSRAGYITVGGQFWHFVQPSLSPTLPFTDVPTTHPFFDSISLLKTNNVSQGCGGGRYCPEDSMTRSEMAAYLARALYGESFSYSSQAAFTDVPSGHPYFRYIQKLKEIGVTTGCTVTTFCPDEIVTRGQMAAFIVRARLGIIVTDLFPFLTTQLFADTNPANIFYSYIQKLKELGVTSGCTATAFCGDDTTTRGQMAVFLARAFLVP